MKLCMFHPVGHPMERGWVGRFDGDRVVHLAAQTLQSFFTGGGAAREHDEYPLSEVRLLTPVLHPPSIRLFDDATTFAFANPAAVVGPGAEIPCNDQLQGLVLAPRIAGIVGAARAPAAFTILAEWRDPTRDTPKDRDFALGLGPVAVTADTFDPRGLAVVRIEDGEPVEGVADSFDWERSVALAAEGTTLYPGDLLAGPPIVDTLSVRPCNDQLQGAGVVVEVEGIGELEQRPRPA
jgi:hypothetical protein